MGGQKLTKVSEMWADIRYDDVDPRIFKRVSLGSGPKNQNPPGFICVDSNPAVEPDVVHDLKVTPWPFEDSSINEIWCCHMLEHLDDPLAFFTELYRVCADKALVHVLCPHWLHEDAYSDPTHKFRVTKRFFDYLSPLGRRLLYVEHYGLTMDFDAMGLKYDLEPRWEGCAADAQIHAIEHYANVVKQLQLRLMVHKPARDPGEMLK